jgi:DNA mismatch repair ATPase MutS
MGADVTMPLSELDSLRDELKEAIHKAAELEQRQSKIRVEVRERVTLYSSEDMGFRTREIRPVFDWKLYPHEYLNMEDVVGPIRDEERSKVQSDLNEKGRRISDLKNKLNIMEAEHKETVRKLREEYEAKLRKLAEIKEESTKDTIIGNLRDQVQHLETTLKKVLAQGFWERIFKPIHISFACPSESDKEISDQHNQDLYWSRCVNRM